MAKSDHAEKTWKDIREEAGFWPVAWLLFVPGGGLESTAKVIENFSKAEAKPSRLSFLLRPLKVVAGAVDRAGDQFSKRDRFAEGSLLAASAPALFAGGKTALALGFSWSGLMAGGHFLGMAGAALGGLGVAFAAYPLAAFTVICAVTGAMAVPLVARDAPKIWRACRDGLHESLARQPAREEIAAAPTAPAASTPAEVPVPALPPLMKDFSAVAAAMKGQDEAERIRFLKSLRRKFPTEFADALRLESHDPELRQDIQVRKPLSFKTKRRGFRLFPGRRP
jgi:hypothetical protein